MNLFTENQVNQVYVTTALKDSHLTAGNSDYGKVYMGFTAPSGKDATSFIEESIYFEHSGPGGITRSDNIDINKIMYVHATPSSEMEKYLQQYEVKVDSSALDSGNVLPNQDYILRIELTNYMGVSPEDSHYWKYGMVHTTGSMSASDFYVALAKSILRNMSREAVKFLKVYLNTNSTAGSVTLSNEVTLDTLSSFTGTYYGLILQEVEPDWILGLKKQKIIHFNLTGVPFDYDGETIYWLSGEDEETELTPTNSDNVINNSKLAADYEYFFHGERGDQYRMVGWPDYIPTQYMVDPNNQYGYDFVQIHYSYIGPNEGAQKSEKDITFLVPKAAAGTAGVVSDAAQAIVDAVQEAIDAKATAIAKAAIKPGSGKISNS